ncbi:grpE protein homolog 2, mitochondrial isoform X2 [Neltuma alba]|uniref:grpE protein homolog 2, mitochondrial isoform X2 n=1 Tax=Neltuma alba TaxID=207710 RepID=UPI0010A3174E|nr:grpE protein homolog 2, mitochondrial-like isoform X2 [Prosopis alba]
MLVSRVLSRVSRSVSRSSSLYSSWERPQNLTTLSNQFHSLLHPSPSTLIPAQVNSLWPPIKASSTPRCGFSSSASPETNEKEQGNATADSAKTSDDANISDQAENSEAANQTQESDSDSESESDLSRDDLIKLVAEKAELLKLKHKEIEKMQDKVLRTYAEMENVMDRTRREAENSKKFAVQNFAKSLLDVADNLGRASSVVKESFSKIDASKDSSGAVPILKTLLEGVEMTDRQLSEVLKKFGVEKFDPTNEPFDPHRHNAVFQIPDGSKPPGTVAAVLKAGYMLYDRVIRPAEVGVTRAVEEDNNATENGNN